MGRNCKKSCECNREYPTWLGCPGEAHNNPFIDNCGICAPEWGRIPYCPNCRTPEGFDVRLVASSNPDKLYCRTCKKHYWL